MIFWSISPIQAETPLPRLQKSLQLMSLQLKQYEVTPGESVQLFGGAIRQFLTPNWLFGAEGAGVVTGKRSGYLEGGVSVGYFQLLTDTVWCQAQLLVGAGGGGSAAQGGGFVVNPKVGLGLALTKGMILGGNVGYVRFLNGRIESLTVDVTVSFYNWLLTYE